MKDYQLSVPSAALARSVSVRFLIPEGTGSKCLILLHGYHGDHNQWCKSSIISELAKQYNCAVVMPSCGDLYYEDTLEDIPRFVGEELVSYVLNALPVSQNKHDFFLGGVSMGGFGALLIGSKYARNFGKIVSLSGAFIIPDVVIGNPGVLGNANPDYFKKVFGDFDTLEGSTRDPVAETIQASTKDLPEIFLLCGSEDALMPGNLKVVKDLRNHNIPVVWYPHKGAHCWSFWNNSLPMIFEWLVEDYVPEGADNGYSTSFNCIL